MAWPRVEPVIGSAIAMVREGGIYREGAACYSAGYSVDMYRP